MAHSTQRHQLAGEHEYDGMVFNQDVPKEMLERVKNDFQLRDDDVILANYPRSGSTWLQEIVWLLMNNANVSDAAQIHQNNRVYFLEVYRKKVPEDIDILEKLESPRIIKTHLGFHFFAKQLSTKKTKVILGARNIKDMLVSYYHFYKMFSGAGNFTGSFAEFFELFKDKHLAFGDWFDFNLEYWKNRHGFNFHLVKYEDLQQDTKGTIKKMSDFLGKSLSKAQFDAITNHVAFDQMKANDQVNRSGNPKMDHKTSPFIRKGKVGDWKNYFTDEQNKYVDKLYEEKIEGTGLSFDFELI